jgi:adenine-specific DNA-methyltransferase
MARAARNTTKDIESLKHREARRKHIPTTELESLVSDEERAPKVIRYKRNTDLDPQLVWRGKDEQDAEELTVDAVPIYIQEKIQPEAIIRDLSRRSEAIRREREERERFSIPDLFRDFNGLSEPGGEFTFYKHDKNWSNRMILGDSLLVMTSLAEKEALTGKVKCIYMDPPYGIRFKSNWQPSTKSPNVSEGQVGLTREPEMIRAFRDTWKDGVHSYLAYLRDRLSIAHRLLDTDGSLFVQIGDENLHLVRALLDEIFGHENFKAIISYKRLGMMVGEELQTSTHFIIWFTKKVDETTPRKLFLNQIAGVGTGDHYSQVEQPDGKVRPLSKEEKASGRLNPVGSRAFQLISLATGGYRENTTVEFKFRGKTYHPGTNKCWRTTPDRLRMLDTINRISRAENTIRYKQYLDDFPLTEITSIWTDTARDPDNLYVVQTPSGIVERCLLMATEPGDLVLDPTCGSGTTSYVAEKWGRRWITIDTSRVALALARQRLMAARYRSYLLNDSPEGVRKEGELTGKPPKNGPFGYSVRQGFVYERIPHITLKSIANNLGLY